MKEINLSNGRICKVDDFGLILEIYIFEAGENEALCCISFNVDDCCKFSFKDNLDYCIDKIRDFVTLTEEDEEQIEDLEESEKGYVRFEDGVYRYVPRFFG